MLKSTYDNRQFKYLELANNLKILLVQDPNCEKSAGSITLNVGHFNDDDDCHGLSHLLEHMLFLGNHEHPTPNAFADYLSAHGGSLNAQTGTEYTSYFYDVAEELQEPALEYFYAMLSQPIFDEKLVAKEINAIDAEFNLKQKDDLRRLYQVHKETCNPSHPFSKFSVGNNETFKPFSPLQLKEKLRQLHGKYYQPHNACLCLVSQNDLVSIEQKVRQTFSSWRNTSSQTGNSLPDLYLDKNLGVKINIKPLQKAQRMIVTFSLPGQQAYFRSKPLNVLSHILGDEGEGGLLDFYKKKGWATTLSAGGGIEGSTFKDFNINLQLTDEGVTHANDMINALFSYIQLIKDDGLEEWRIKETATLNQLMWDFADNGKPIDEAMHFSQSMFEYPEEYLLAGDYIIDKPDTHLTSHMLDFFTPSNMRVKVVNSKVNTTNIAKWYHTPYSVEELDSAKLEDLSTLDWITHFALPKENAFLHPPQKPKAIDINYQLPVQIVKEPSLNLWFGQDQKFKQPKGDCYLTFDCQATYEGIELVTSKRLWVALLNEKLNQKYYQANLAGMHFHLYPHQGGFSLQTNGFSTNQLSFITNLLTQIVVNEDFTQSFKQIKAKQHQALSNALLNKPINRLFSRLSVLMQQQNYSPLDMANIMADLSPDDVILTKNKLFNQFHLEGLMYGDWLRQEADDISKVVKQFKAMYASCKKVTRGVADIRNMAPHTHYVECKQKDPAVVIYFQAPTAQMEDVALTILVEQLVATPFFNQIRTEQQLGYMVGSGYIPYNQHPGIGFYIQSPHTPVPKLIAAIHIFLQQLIHNIDQFAPAWDTIKKGVIKQLTEKDTNLSMKSQRLWMAIGNQDYDFSHSERMTQTISNIDFESLKAFLHRLMALDGFGQIILSNNHYDTKAMPFETSVISDINAFKSTSSYL